MGNGCGLQMDGISSHFEPSESISFDVPDFGHFGVVSGGLMLFSEGPRTLRDRSEGPGTLRVGGSQPVARGGVATGRNLWGLVGTGGTGGDWWRLVGTSRGPMVGVEAL